MDEKRLAEIEARANAATPGPWEPEHRGVVGNDVFIVEDCVTAGWDAYRANQAFIAAARADVPALVAEVRRLTVALATVTAARDACAARCDAIYTERDDAARKRRKYGTQNTCDGDCARLAGQAQGAAMCVEAIREGGE